MAEIINNLNSPDFDLLKDITAAQTNLDKRMIPKVVKLINKYGKTVVFKLYPNAKYNPPTGDMQNLDPIGYIKKIIPPYNYDDKYINGDLIKVGDMQSGMGVNYTSIPSGVQVVINGQPINIVMDGNLINVAVDQSPADISNVDFKPKEGVEIIIDGLTWKIVRVMPIYSGQLIALYLFQLRR